MFVKNGTGNARGACVIHPNRPHAVVFEGGTEDENVFAMVGESFATLGIFVHKCLYANGNERMGIIVVRPKDIYVRQKFGMQIRLFEEEEMLFGLRDSPTPQVERESVGGAAENTNEVVLPRLEGFFGDVAAMIVGRDQLVRHVCGRDLSFVSSGDLIVKNLMGGNYALEPHSGKATSLGEDEFALGAILHWFNPCQTAVDVK